MRNRKNGQESETLEQQPQNAAGDPLSCGAPGTSHARDTAARQHAKRRQGAYRRGIERRKQCSSGCRCRRGMQKAIGTGPSSRGPWPPRVVIRPRACMHISGVGTGRSSFRPRETAPPRREGRRLSAFRYHTSIIWFRSLRRRSQRRRLTWERTIRLIKRFLPSPSVLHPWPNHRSHVKYSK
jgi:hypothetical protein